MSAFQKFRSAFNGFNREDVVHYIEYMNNKHTAQVNQYKTDLQALQAELAEKPATVDMTEELNAALAAKEAAEAEVASLRAQLAEAQAKLAAAPKVEAPTFDELEAYRRAERAERLATERVSQMYQQANGALADAATRVDEVSLRITEITDRISTEVAELKTALCQSKTAMKSVSATLYNICPLSDEE